MPLDYLSELKESCAIAKSRSLTVTHATKIPEYALSTKRCMLGNQDRYLAGVVLFLLCSPILSPLEVVSRKVFDEFTQLNKGRNLLCRIYSSFLGTCS